MVLFQAVHVHAALSSGWPTEAGATPSPRRRRTGTPARNPAGHRELISWWSAIPVKWWVPVQGQGQDEVGGSPRHCCGQFLPSGRKGECKRLLGPTHHLPALAKTRPSLRHFVRGTRCSLPASSKLCLSWVQPSEPTAGEAAWHSEMLSLTKQVAVGRKGIGVHIEKWPQNFLSHTVLRSLPFRTQDVAGSLWVYWSVCLSILPRTSSRYDTPKTTGLVCRGTLMVTGPGKMAQNWVTKSEYGVSFVLLDKRLEILSPSDMKSRTGIWQKSASNEHSC